jgi:hypothetical protein
MCNRSQEVQLELGYMTEVGHATEVTYMTRVMIYLHYRHV